MLSTRPAMVRLLHQSMQSCMHALHGLAACEEMQTLQLPLHSPGIATWHSCVTWSLPAVAPRMLCWLDLLLDMSCQEALLLRHLRPHQHCFLVPRRLDCIYVWSLASLCQALPRAVVLPHYVHCSPPLPHQCSDILRHTGGLAHIQQCPTHQRHLTTLCCRAIFCAWFPAQGLPTAQARSLPACKSFVHFVISLTLAIVKIRTEISSAHGRLRQQGRVHIT